MNDPELVNHPALRPYINQEDRNLSIS